MEQAAIHQLLVERCGEAVLAFHDEGVERYAEIAPQKIAEVAAVLRDAPELACDQLMCLSGIDWDGYDENGKGKSVAILGYGIDGKAETSDRVGEGDLGVAYHFYSHSHRHKFTLQVRLPRAGASLPSVAQLWPTAAWHEREAWDLVGIRFAGHPDLRRILLEDSWEGHPLRKDYQMPDQWDEAPLEGKPLSDDKRPNKPQNSPPDPNANPNAKPAPPVDTRPEDGGGEG